MYRNTILRIRMPRNGDYILEQAFKREDHFRCFGDVESPLMTMLGGRGQTGTFSACNVASKVGLFGNVPTKLLQYSITMIQPCWKCSLGLQTDAFSAKMMACKCSSCRNRVPAAAFSRRCRREEAESRGCRDEVDDFTDNDRIRGLND